MAKKDWERHETAHELDEFPEVELDWIHDNNHNPSQLTVFDPSGDSIATAWVTVDCETGISLDQIQ